jgi:DNA-binding beta-propeller fold protein YncE
MKVTARRSSQLARWPGAIGVLVALAAGVGDSNARLFQSGRLVAYEPLPTLATGDVCVMPAPLQRDLRRAMLQEGGGRPVPGTLPNSPYRDYTRRIRDEYPTFAAVSVDTARNEVVFTDENTFKILVYDRLEHTPADAPFSQPKRVITGDKTEIEFQSGVYVDPKSGEIWAANNDTRDRFVVFAAGANGDVAPVRTAETPHGTFGVVVDEAHGEALFTIQHDSALVTYRRNANGEDSPIRMMQGDRTGLQDPHGIALDSRDDVIFISNFGSTHSVSGTIQPREGVPSAGNHEGKDNWPLGREYAVPGSGTINEPSIIVHRRTASGDVPPLRVIKGPKTQMNWPTGLSFDPQARELFVANDAGMSILVFDADAQGDVAPKRVIRGPKTKLANPTGVFADVQNGELWVTNFGGHSATVYDLKAAGDVAPKRLLRNAPEGTPSLMIGNPGTLGYDTRREQILVPN